MRGLLYFEKKAIISLKPIIIVVTVTGAEQLTLFELGCPIRIEYLDSHTLAYMREPDLAKCIAERLGWEPYRASGLLDDVRPILTVLRVFDALRESHRSISVLIIPKICFVEDK